MDEHHVNTIFIFSPFSISAYSKLNEASLPTSPTHQMNWIRENKPYIEMETTALEKYVKFILSDDHNINIPPMSKSQLKRIKSNLNQAWFKNIMMKRKVAAIDKDVLENHR